MWKVYLENNNNDIIAVKIFGELGNEMIDREKEKKLMLELNNDNIGARLLAMFKNGFAYEFAAGSNPSAENIFEPKFMRLLTKEFHKIHSFMSENGNAPGALIAKCVVTKHNNRLQQQTLIFNQIRYN